MSGPCRGIAIVLAAPDCRQTVSNADSMDGSSVVLEAGNSRSSVEYGLSDVVLRGFLQMTPMILYRIALVL